MMPDLGHYATEVLTAYAGSLLLLGLVVFWSVWRARCIRRALEDMEQRRGKQA